MNLKETAYYYDDRTELAHDNVQWLDFANTMGEIASEFCKRLCIWTTPTSQLLRFVKFYVNTWKYRQSKKLLCTYIINDKTTRS
jgi:hypothetical protein